MAFIIEKHRGGANAAGAGGAGAGAGVGRAASVVCIPKISRYTDFQNSVFLEAKGGALLYVHKSLQLGIFAQILLKMG